MALPIPNYKEIVELLKIGSTIEAQEKIMELRVAALEYQNENLELRGRIKDLEAALSLRDRLKWQKPYYVDKENPEEKFCQRCYDVDGKAIRLQGDEFGSWQCLACSSAYFNDDYDPSNDNEQTSDRSPITGY